jgi:hypothetical protein
MISFSIDKQRGQVNAEGMSRPVDTKIKIKKQSTAGLGLDIHGAVTYFCFSTEKKLLRGPIIGGAYIWTSRKKERDEDFKRKLRIKWDTTDNVFVLRDYEFRESSDWVKNLMKNVKSSCKIGVKRASR